MDKISSTAKAVIITSFFFTILNILCVVYFIDWHMTEVSIKWVYIVYWKYQASLIAVGTGCGSDYLLSYTTVSLHAVKPVCGCM